MIRLVLVVSVLIAMSSPNHIVLIMVGFGFVKDQTVRRILVLLLHLQHRLPIARRHRQYRRVLVALDQAAGLSPNHIVHTIAVFG